MKTKRKVIRHKVKAKRKLTIDERLALMEASQIDRFRVLEKELRAQAERLGLAFTQIERLAGSINGLRWQQTISVSEPPPQHRLMRRFKFVQIDNGNCDIGSPVVIEAASMMDAVERIASGPSFHPDCTMVTIWRD